MPDSFSQRQQLAGPPAGTLLRDEVPISFRMFLIDVPHDSSLHLESFEMRKVVCAVLQKWPEENMPPYHDYKRHVQRCEWFYIYEIIEGLYRLLEKKSTGFDYYSSRFGKTINDALIEHNLGWQLTYDGRISMRGGDVFEGTMNTAISVLSEDQKPTAAGHLWSAILALSMRPKPNTSGAVFQSTNALECVLGEITGEAMTLGEYLKTSSDLFPGSMKKALEGIWGYASNEGARHGKEGIEPSSEEAEFVLAVCAATCTLLIKKHPK